MVRKGRPPDGPPDLVVRDVQREDHRDSRFYGPAAPGRVQRPGQRVDKGEGSRVLRRRRPVCQRAGQRRVIESGWQHVLPVLPHLPVQSCPALEPGPVGCDSVKWLHREGGKWPHLPTRRGGRPASARTPIARRLSGRGTPSRWPPPAGTPSGRDGLAVRPNPRRHDKPAIADPTRTRAAPFSSPRYAAKGPRAESGCQPASLEHMPAAPSGPVQA
jgi:hypothetical protein